MRESHPLRLSIPFASDPRLCPPTGKQEASRPETHTMPGQFWHHSRLALWSWENDGTPRHIHFPIARTETIKSTSQRARGINYLRFEDEMCEVFTFSLPCPQVFLTRPRSHREPNPQRAWKVQDPSYGPEARINSSLSFSLHSTGMQGVCRNSHGLADIPPIAGRKLAESGFHIFIHLFHKYLSNTFDVRDSLGHWEYSNKQNIKNPFVLEFIFHWEVVGWGAPHK